MKLSELWRQRAKAIRSYSKDDIEARTWEKAAKELEQHCRPRRRRRYKQVKE